MSRTLPAFLLASLLAWASGPARAAESYDSCTGSVDSLPATLSTQGTWCLRANLATAIATGNAITVANNNIVLDCNHFGIDGSGAGAGTQATGIVAQGRSALVVRNCGVQGFLRGLLMVGDNIEVRGNHVVRAKVHGMLGSGNDLLVQDNRVLETGGSSTFGSAIGIYVQGRVDTLDNLVGDTRATVGLGGNATGIYYGGASSGSVRGNRVFGVTGDGAGLVAGIKTENALRVQISGNHMVSNAAAGTGLQCLGPDVATSSARDNTILAFALGVDGCPDDLSSNQWTP